MSKTTDLVAKATVKSVVKFLLGLFFAVAAVGAVVRIIEAEDKFDALLQAHNDTLRVSAARDDSIQRINQAVDSLEEQIVEKDADIAVLNTYGLRLAGTVAELNSELAEAIADSNFTDRERLDIAIVTIATQDSSNQVCEEKFNACQEKAVIFESIVDSLGRASGILIRDRDGFKSIAEELRKAKECKLPLGIKCPSRGLLLLIGGVGGFTLGWIANGGGEETTVIVEQPREPREDDH